MNKLWRWLLNDWWRPDQGEDGTWGIYHPWRWHSWEHGRSLSEAKAECRRLNNLPGNQQPGFDFDTREW